MKENKMDLIQEYLNSVVFPAAVRLGGFGEDVGKFLRFEAHENQVNAQFCSIPIFGDVSLEKKTHSERFVQPVFVKMQSRADFLSQETADAMFHNEVLFYTKIVPLLRKYDTCNVLSTSFPECVYGRATNGLNPDEDVLVLKDLRQKGFKSCVNHKLDENHIELILDRLGKYHALSFLCKTDVPDRFAEVAAEIKGFSLAGLAIGIGGFVTKEAYKDAMFRGIDPLRHESEYQDRLADLYGKRENADFWVDQYACAAGELLGIISHGDFRMDNMMFKYHDNGKPSEVTFFDLGFVRSSTPAIDIAVILFYDVPLEIRRARWDHLLRVYYDALSDQMRENRDAIPSLETVKMNLRKRGMYGYCHVASYLPTVMCVKDGVSCTPPPALDGLEQNQLQEAMETHMRNLREKGGSKVTETLKGISQFMIDKEFIFEY